MKEFKIKECPFCKGSAELVLDYHEDGHRYPRDFWHAKVECSTCDATQGFSPVSEQEAEKEDISEEIVSAIVGQWNYRQG